jgi:hypothetical protein
MDSTSCNGASPLHHKLDADCTRFSSILYSISNNNTTRSFLEELFAEATSSTASYGEQ